MKKRNISFGVLLCTMLFNMSLFAQVNMTVNTTTSSVVPAGGTQFYDNGGPAAAYSNNCGPLTVHTFNPTAGNKVLVQFTAFQVENNWDALYIYNGATTAAPLYPGGGGATTGGFPAGGFTNATLNGQCVVASTNSLTFQFRSDASVTQAGWAANVFEIPASTCTGTLATPAAVNVAVTTPGPISATVPTPTFVGCTTTGTQLQYSLNGGAWTNATPPSVVISTGLVLGQNTVSWRLQHTATGCILATTAGAQIVTVTDGVPPTITCPASVTINLDPGECATQFAYNVTCTDNFPFVVATGSLTHQAPSATPPNGQSGIMFDIKNETANDMTITGFTPSLDAGNHTVQVYSTTTATTWNGNATNAGAWTLHGAAAVTSTGPGVGTAVSGFGITLAPGQQKGIYLTCTNGTFMNYSNGTLTSTDGNLTINPSGAGAGSAHPFAGFFTPRIYMGAVAYQINSSTGPTTQTAGLPSGSEFPIGVTTNTFSCTDAAGNVATCSFSVTVNEYPNAITTLVCNDLVNISLDATCTATINADQVLEGGPYGCYDDYVVTVDKVAPYGNGPWVPAVLGPGDINKTYGVKVTDPATGNSCWGLVKIEDKIKPNLVCPSVTLPCNFDINPTFSTTTTVTSKYAATGLPLPLVDFQTVTLTIPVNAPANAVINDVDFRTLISGSSFFFNVVIDVTSPAGTKVNVWNQVGGCFPDPIFARFDDEGSNALTCANFTTDQNAQIPFGFGVLSDFDGENPNGDWTITIKDVDASGDVSSIEIAELYINLTGTFSAGFPNSLVFPTQVSQTGANTFVATAGTGTPVLDACSNVTLSYVDQNVPQACATGLTAIVNRKWTAVDASGNSSTCIQTINLTRPTLADVVPPSDYDDIDAPAFACGSAYPTPEVIEGQGLQGWPYVFGEPNGCSINWTYEDVVIDVCDGTYKIRRRWSIIDWCLGDGIEYNQIIKVLDNDGPTWDCPADLTVSTDAFTCCATVDLPDAIVEDDCSRINNVSAMVIGISYEGDTLGMFTYDGSVRNFPGNNFWDRDTLGQFGTTACLPRGKHTVVYTAEDDCGNTSTCQFTLTILDLTPPQTICTEFTTVSVTWDDPTDCYLPNAASCEFAGVSWVDAESFDQGSYDNCGNLYFTVRRMPSSVEPNGTIHFSDCIDNLNATNGFPATPNCDDPFFDIPSEYTRATGYLFNSINAPLWKPISLPAVNYQCIPTVHELVGLDSIKFYCCEVGTTQTVILRAYQLDDLGRVQLDQNGESIWNECMVQITVQDKIKPVCQAPASVTVSCEAFDPSLWAYGYPTVTDNCCLDSTKSISAGGNTYKGLTEARDYSRFDTLCNRGTITRTFRAYDCHGLSSTCSQRVFVNYNQDYHVRFPNDVIVTVCDGTGNYGEPTINKKDCELMAISYVDEIFTVVPDACYKIERTWTIINWCTYDPNQPCIYVPNPNPNAVTNHPTNLPGPTVSPLGTPSPWAPTSVKISPTDPTATNYSTFWNKDANCYKYKQIIKVLDTQDPIVDGCTVNGCDLTANDANFWNTMDWYDNVTGQHDLCEAPVDICVTAADACSGTNINISALLFLDLDGDGVMETVVNSNNFPAMANSVASGTILYNNYQNPSYTGGVARQYDHRPVANPDQQKYRFALQQTVANGKRTACIRWNTKGSPNTFVPVQLPYGKHKVKWFISDNCGNESVCESAFEVKDCKKPTVVCLNGLSVNIMQTKMVTLWASDFLQYGEDNCTPADRLVYSIRKSGTGTGFPVDANGNPVTSLTWNCNELGTQYVELWAKDLAGNADFCETYVIVQDNMGNCSNNASVAGDLKTEANNGLEEANVELNGTHPALPAVNMFKLSGSNGHYEFSNAIPMASNYTVTPVKDDNPLNGVSTYDLLLISKHILGVQPLTTPYQMIAADVNKSGSITTYDIVELRKLILGIYNTLPANTSWRFVDAAYTFPNPANPFQAQFPEVKTVAQVSANQMNENFVSVKVGDVNGNAVANNLMSADDRTAGTLLFDVEDRAVKAGEEFTVNFKAAEKVLGYQFTMKFNNLEVAEIVPGAKMSTDNFAVFAADNMMTTSFDADAAGEFSVKFRATAAGKISNMIAVSSNITTAEAYTLNAERSNVAFRFNENGTSTIAGVGFELYQNQPNPFINKTVIGFNLPEATTATLTIFDETGRMLFTQKGDFAKGVNSISVDRALLNTTGLMYYKLETANNSASKKMIQTK